MGVYHSEGSRKLLTTDFTDDTDLDEQQRNKETKGDRGRASDTLLKQGVNERSVVKLGLVVRRSCVCAKW